MQFKLTKEFSIFNVLALAGMFFSAAIFMVQRHLVVDKIQDENAQIFVKIEKIEASISDADKGNEALRTRISEVEVNNLKIELLLKDLNKELERLKRDR